MFDIEKAKVMKIVSKNPYKTTVVVLINNKEALAINYDNLTGPIEIDDYVLLNTTAVNLNLGTGGYHFVVSNLDKPERKAMNSGHIMKLRYTPYQLKVLSAEEQESSCHNIFKTFVSLEQMPIIVGTLHSMLIPIVATLKYLSPKTKIAYMMTDAASLPIWLSDTVTLLKEKKLLDSTITTGHAFGGDIETVNIYNGLIAAKEISNCDIGIVLMGPGIVGTGTKYGFTGIEQGYILDSVSILGGCGIGIPRISFSDKRERHRGISHHSITVFTEITHRKAFIPIYNMDDCQYKIIDHQIKKFDLSEKHNIIVEKENVLEKALKHFNLSVETMGRTYYEDPSYFLTCSAGALVGLKKLLR